MRKTVTGSVYLRERKGEEKSYQAITPRHHKSLGVFPTWARANIARKLAVYWFKNGCEFPPAKPTLIITHRIGGV